MLSNPATFRLNGVTFGVSTHDVLFQLGKSELNVGSSQVHPYVHSICSHTPFRKLTFNANVHLNMFMTPRVPNIIYYRKVLKRTRL